MLTVIAIFGSTLAVTQPCKRPVPISGNTVHAPNLLTGRNTSIDGE